MTSTESPPRRLAIVISVLVVALVVPLGVVAADEFTDVGSGNPFRADISWLADEGISRGCNPPANTQFCPDADVTREQMAAFLHRLATSRSVDAGTLGGRTAAQIAPRLSAQADGQAGSVQETDSGLVEVNRVEINAPTDGFLMVSGTGMVNPQGSLDIAYILRTRVDGQLVGNGQQNWSSYNVPISAGAEFELSYTIAVPVAKGGHVVTQEIGPRLGTATFMHNHETLTVLFVPGAQGSLVMTSGVGDAPDSQFDR